ncbi:hypothetical protein Y1Q_0004452 [Alligator mississippiensis]|uniref:Uncharacterized protein n=1 Tax=Alligator mississippiensis TaxID=8496 RepID=A0A151NSX5_ALLMI|nr:hypothetical protein Y1Q_0004452 [Alligator mississippiensis]
MSRICWELQHLENSSQNQRLVPEGRQPLWTWGLGTNVPWRRGHRFLGAGLRGPDLCCATRVTVEHVVHSDGDFPNAQAHKCLGEQGGLSLFY